MSTEQNYSGEAASPNPLEPTAQPQPPAAQTQAQARTSADERQAGESAYQPKSKEITLRPSAIDFYVGDQAHQLFFALTAQLRTLTQDMVVEFDPNDLPSHIDRWNDVEHLLELLTGLFTKTNWYAEQLTDRLRDLQNPGWRTMSEETYTQKAAFWATKAPYHPALEGEGNGHD